MDQKLGGTQQKPSHHQQRKKKRGFIDRSQAVQYRVVHRSQRDPLLADESASRFVLAPVPPSRNLLKKGKFQGEGVLQDVLDYNLGDELSDDVGAGLSAGEDDDGLDAGGVYVVGVRNERHLRQIMKERDGSDDYSEDGREVTVLEEPDKHDEEEGEWVDDDELDVDDVDQGGQFDDAEEDETEALPEFTPSTKRKPSTPKSQQMESQVQRAASSPKSKNPTQTKTIEKEEPSMHGIFFEDQGEYDYMQHLKPIGEDPSAVFMEAPKPKSERKAGKAGGIVFRDEDVEMPQRRKVTFELPEEALPSSKETTVGLLNQRAVDVDGLMLDVAPEVREVIYALEDDAYVDEELDDDFFAALTSEALPEKYVTLVEEAEKAREAEESRDDEDDWVSEFRKYKRKQAAGSDEDGDSDDDEEDGRRTTASGMSSQRRSSGGPKTAKTSFSVMSSSTLFRNDQLTLLDDRFERLISTYSDGEDEEDLDDDVEQNSEQQGSVRFRYVGGDGEDDQEEGDEDEEDEAAANGMLPTGIALDRFRDMMDEFLDKADVSGRRMVIRPEGLASGGVGQYDAIRDALGWDAKDAVLAAAARQMEQDELGQEDETEDEVDEVEEDGRERGGWDVETVLTTHTNIYNRPALIREKPRRIRLDRNGVPRLEEAKPAPMDSELQTENSESEPDEADQSVPVNKGTARTKGESAEEKKTRKAQIKAERRSRREEKKSTKRAFDEERKKQVRLRPTATKGVVPL
ncbi:Low temperature viability protein-domain-containing protein [Cladochytrium replicatum]|nr:Low temperature viability protein-domain-containing protein [Cladochytrium replicatum]